MAHDFGFEPALDNYYFVSYCGRYPNSLQRTAEICRELNKLNVPLWYDKAIPMGVKYAAEIAKRIEKCNCMLLFVSQELVYNPEGEEDSYVLVEFDIARRRKKKIIPIFMDNIDGNKVHTDFDEFYSLIKKLQGIELIKNSSAQNSARNICNNMNFNINIKTNVTDGNTIVHESKKKSVSDSIIHTNGSHEIKARRIKRDKYEFCLELKERDVVLFRKSNNSNKTIMGTYSNPISKYFHDTAYYGIVFDDETNHIILKKAFYDEYCGDFTFTDYEFIDPFGDCTKCIIHESKIICREDVESSTLNGFSIHINC